MSDPREHGCARFGLAQGNRRMHARCDKRVRIVALLFCTIPAAYQAEASAQDTLTGSIIQAWREREQNIRSLVFEWQEAEFIARGVLSFDRVEGEPLVSIPVTYPPQDTTHNSVYTLKIDGQKLRSERLGPQLVQHLGEYLPRWGLTVNDGEVSKSFVDKDRSGDERSYAAGFIRQPGFAQQIDARNIKYRAILLCYRPLAICKGVGYDLSRYSVAPTRARFAEHDCVVLSSSDDVGKSILWVDAERGFLPMRWQRMIRGRPSLQLDVEYTHDTPNGWYPSGWKYSVYAYEGQSAGKLQHQCSARVGKHELNTRIPASEFQYEFPAGTYVADERMDQYYILRQDGEKRIVTDDEMAAGYSYERLAATESGKAGQRDRGAITWACAIGLTGILVALVLAFVRRYRRSLS